MKSAVAPQISILERSGRMEKRASEHLSATIVLSVDQYILAIRQNGEESTRS